MLIVCNKLDETSGAGLQRLASRGDDLKVDRGCSAGGEVADLPGRGLANTDFGLADARRLLAARDGVTNETRHF